MTAIHIKKTSEFETRPEFDIPRQARKKLESLISTSPDTPHQNSIPGNLKWSYLNQLASTLKANSLNAQQFEETQNVDIGNLILETRVQLVPPILMIYINLQDIGITVGRGEFEIRPTENGFWLLALETECFKNTKSEEAHAMQRIIKRNYTIRGQYDWRNLHHSLMPEGSLHIVVQQVCHPGTLLFPAINQGTAYSSLPVNPGFPPIDPSCHFGAYIDPCSTTPKQRCQCEAAKSVGLQTDSIHPDMEVQTQTSMEQIPSTTSCLGLIGSDWFPCSCEPMECG